MTETGGGTTGGGAMTPAGQGTTGPKTGWQWKPWVETPALPAAQEEKTLGLVLNLAAIFGLLGLVAVVVLWLVKKDTSRFLDAVGKETLNFQISAIIYFVGASLVAVPLMYVCGLGAVIYLALGLVFVIFLILAAIKSNDGLIYRFPVNLRLIK